MKDKYCLIDYSHQGDFLYRENQAEARFLLGMFLNFLDLDTMILFKLLFIMDKAHTSYIFSIIILLIED